MEINPFDHRRFIGYVSKVTPELTQVHFPNSKLLKKFYYNGDTLHGGVVRNFVIIEGEDHGFLAKIVSVELPEKERGFLSEAAFQNEDKMHPIGKVEIQLCFNIFGDVKAKKGLDQYPPVGSKVYVCSPQILKEFLKDFGKSEDEKCDDLLKIATLPQDQGYDIEISANALFGRHCAIVGTTGGGKSYTIAKLIEEMIGKEESIKIILLDATGEFENLCNEDSILAKIGKGGNSYLSYTNLTESDLFALFRPSGQIQVPVLQKAIKSLKLARAIEKQKEIEEEKEEIFTTPNFYENGWVKKSGKLKQEFNDEYAKYIELVESPTADFDIQKLSQQIINECIWEDGNFGKDPTTFGGEDAKAKEYSTSLIMRINARITNSSFAESFGLSDMSKKYKITNSSGKEEEKEKSSFEKVFSDFYSGDKSLLKINISTIDFEENLREIVTNSIGRYFLGCSQKEKKEFKEKPILFFLDEAHQVFRTEKIKDEYSNEFKLDAFERIAKECRKFGLFLVLSTQRPRDIPQGVLSQMGTFIAHRLINQYDKEAVENASPEGSKYVLSFLPSLGQGEAILMGVDFPMPINLKIKPVKEENKPNSNTPKLFLQ